MTSPQIKGQNVMPVAEVILVTQNEDIEDSSTLIHTCLSLDRANEVLDDISFANLDEDNCKAYRGILTDAKTIPENFLGCAPYIIVQIPGQEETAIDYIEAHFEKAPMSSKGVQDRIQELLSQELVFDTENGVSIMGIPTLDDIFIFFGVKLHLTLHINEQDTDEEFEDRLSQLQNSLSIINRPIQNTTYEGSEGVLPNMQKTVVLTITPKSGHIYTLEGRLLGGCITEEAAKLVQNKDISERIHTGESQPMSAVLDYLIKLESDNQPISYHLRTHGHFVVAVSTIADNIDILSIKTKSRQLYISPEIRLTSEYVHTNSTSSATFECVDGTTITMKEKIITESANA